MHSLIEQYFVRPLFDMLSLYPWESMTLLLPSADGGCSPDVGACLAAVQRAELKENPG